MRAPRNTSLGQVVARLRAHLGSVGIAVFAILAVQADDDVIPPELQVPSAAVIVILGTLAYQSRRVQYAAWRMQRRVRSLPVTRGAAPHPMLPVADLDFVNAPHTGLTRRSWEGIARSMLENALHYSAGLRAPLRFPAARHFERPDLASDGPWSQYVEGFARTMLLATPLVVRNPELRVGDRNVADYYREYLVHGCTPGHAAWFGQPRGKRPTQHVCEAAAIALCLLEGSSVLWEPLSQRDKDRVADWMEWCHATPVYTNNWRWFNVILDLWLRRVGRRGNADVAAQHIAAVRAMHVDAGWFKDREKFDYYSAWAQQFYPTFWAAWDPAPDPAIVAEFAERSDRFLETYPHLFSRDGAIPLWGRSVCYRFAASAPLALAFRRATPAIDPGFARRLCSGNLLQFVRHPSFLRGGLPSLGFYGPDASIVDRYSRTPSSYWCAKLFFALLLPDDNPFWTARETEGFWAAPPRRVEFGTTGIAVEHDRVTGHSRLYADQSAAQSSPHFSAWKDDPRYTAPYFDTAGVAYSVDAPAVTREIFRR